MFGMNVGPVCIVSPAVAANNNGNWHTAARWHEFLQAAADPHIIPHWEGAPAVAMIALHAIRSADSVRRFRDAFPARPIAVVLTGTDVYGGMNADSQAMDALQCASHIVVLQAMALDRLEVQHRKKARVVLQSAPRMLSARRLDDRHEFVAVGHLRDVKDPLTFMRASVALRGAVDARFVHIGEAIEPALGAAARDAMAACASYRWLGGMSQKDARARIADARALVHMSRLEGGANVVIEAVRSAVPVLASHIEGNVGLLGPDYGGYFPVGHVACLTDLIRRVSEDRAFHAELRRQCVERSPLFAPEAEMQAVQSLLRDMLGAHRP
ncbi:MAG: TIGR04348 family glycosyltransferase [Pseudomonadota bacterium]|nr:TIGR04348 family glycosyltransferase [Pseudomonadota bacterium]